MESIESLSVYYILYFTPRQLYRCSKMEHQTGLEPVYNSFAENCLAIWLLVQIGEEGRGYTYKMYYLTSILYTGDRADPHVYIFVTSS